VLNEVHACPSAQSVPACRRRPRPRPRGHACTLVYGTPAYLAELVLLENKRRRTTAVVG
jgi:hypothetical protein